jgi:hypothetical protein
MNALKRTGMICLAWVALLVGDALLGGQSYYPLPDFVTDASARVGRPLTPVSVAGAARRTTRRCAAGVYNC